MLSWSMGLLVPKSASFTAPVLERSTLPPCVFKRPRVKDSAGGWFVLCAICHRDRAGDGGGGRDGCALGSVDAQVAVASWLVLLTYPPARARLAMLLIWVRASAWYSSSTSAVKRQDRRVAAGSLPQIPTSTNPLAPLAARASEQTPADRIPTFTK